jgi:hypothetical protein
VVNREGRDDGSFRLDPALLVGGGDLACATSSCTTKVAVATNDLCNRCEADLFGRRTRTRSPGIDYAHDLAISWEDLQANVTAITAPMAPDEEREAARIWDLARRFAATYAQVSFPLTWQDMPVFILALLRSRGIDPTAGQLPDHERVVRKTFERQLRLLDRQHQRLTDGASPPPWSTYKNSADPAFYRNIKASFLREHAGHAKDPLELPHMLRVVDHLMTPEDHRVREAALLAVVADPTLLAVEDGKRVGASFWTSVLADAVLPRPDGSVLVSGTYYRTKNVIVPPGRTANLLIAALGTVRIPLTDETGAIRLDPHGMPDRVPHEGPLFTSRSSAFRGQPLTAQGVADAVRLALVDGGIPEELHGKLTWVKIGRGDVPQFPHDNLLHGATARVAALHPRRVQLAAWVSNAWFVAARGTEILKRTMNEAVTVERGVQWHLAGRKNDPTGRDPWRGAPHLPYPTVDPLAILHRHRQLQRQRLLSEGVDEKDLPDAPLFAGNLAQSRNGVLTLSTFRRQLAEVLEELDLGALDVGTHGIRRGFATTGAYLGFSDHEIMSQGSWKDQTTFQGYIAGASPLSGRSLAAKYGRLLGGGADIDPLEANVTEVLRGIHARAAADGTPCTCALCGSVSVSAKDRLEALT